MEMDRQGAERALRELGWPAVFSIHSTRLAYLMALAGDMKATLKTTWTVPPFGQTCVISTEEEGLVPVVNSRSSLSLAFVAFVGHCVGDIIKILTGQSQWLSNIFPAWSMRKQWVPFCYGPAGVRALCPGSLKCEENICVYTRFLSLLRQPLLFFQAGLRLQLFSLCLSCMGLRIHHHARFNTIFSKV